MRPWAAGLLAYLIVGLIALEFSPAAGGLIGLLAGVSAYLVQRRRLDTSADT